MRRRHRYYVDHPLTGPHGLPWQSNIRSPCVDGVWTDALRSAYLSTIRIRRGLDYFSAAVALFVKANSGN